MTWAPVHKVGKFDSVFFAASRNVDLTPSLARAVEAQPASAEAGTRFVVCRALTYAARASAVKGRL